MKTLIIYASSHHLNTKKVVNYLHDNADVDIIDINKATNIKIDDYQLIGFASGIYFNKMDKKIIDCINEISFSLHQKIFLLYTCGLHYTNYVKELEILFKQRNLNYGGCFYCRGYDTFGFLKRIGGISRKHPNQKDLNNAKKFIDNLKETI